MFLPYLLLLVITACAAAAIHRLRASRRVLEERLVTVEKMEAESRARALTDPITGLKNRIAFTEELEAVVQAGRHTGVAVLFLDLDRFKEVNDSLGHKVGDGLLNAVAQRLTGVIGPKDTLARIGGDEFAAIIRLDPTRSVQDMAAAMVETVYEPYLIDGHLVHVGTSVGAVIGSEATTCASDLLRQADIAMYDAKVSKSASFKLFDDRMSEIVAVRTSMRGELEDALREDHLTLALQPLIDTKTGTLASVEALLRWPNSSRGPISPADLIPLAEASGQILQLGEWVLDKALTIAEELGDVPIAVNVSPIQFRHHGFATKVSEKLLATGVSPHLLRLEITEGVLISHIDAAKSTIRQLRQIGVEVVLDDFGTGYSSLSYLQNLDLDCVKIDKSFLKDLGRDSRAVQIMRSVIDLGHSLELKVVAEGVENEWQARLLQMLNCDYLQGYFLGVPMSLTDLKAYIADRSPRLALLPDDVSDAAPKLQRIG
ncbi:EAL domain-containing protein [Sphingomonas parva]|uniref:EAL domain-containing protein n=1 Tax=Sphingomonas parva TaxID=2555898 RepID=A0A4Y8ZSU4_9SPHN|nr:EAL domain-containing protein [Sphingomonas parva]TFI59083.1 EAL domain-containing protein [Sphingomonas parva]